VHAGELVGKGHVLFHAAGQDRSRLNSNIVSSFLAYVCDLAMHTHSVASTSSITHLRSCSLVALGKLTRTSRHTRNKREAGAGWHQLQGYPTLPECSAPACAAMRRVWPHGAAPWGSGRCTWESEGAGDSTDRAAARTSCTHRTASSSSVVTMKSLRDREEGAV
jgi:hypothetical protein